MKQTSAIRKPPRIDLRAILVCGRAELWAAVREAVTPEQAVVLPCTASNFLEAFRRCQPWPVMVILDRDVRPEGPSLHLLRTRPVCVIQWSRPDERLIETAALITDLGPSGWSAVIQAVVQRLTQSVGDITLHPHVGVRVGGEAARNPSLEAALVAYPHKVPMDALRAHRLRACLVESSPYVRLERGRGGLGLVEVQAPALELAVG